MVSLKAPVLAPLDGIRLDPDHLHPVFVEDSRLGQVRGQVQAGLSAQVRQQRVGRSFSMISVRVSTFSGSI